MSFDSTSVLVTGACGTIGSELVRQIAETGATRIVCVDNNESAMFFLREQYRGDPRVECYLTDLRDDREMKRRMEGIDIALHSAALKHVELCEQSPTQAVRTNIDGTQNVIDAARKNDVSSVVCLSTDKAVMPANAMGMKGCGEAGTVGALAAVANAVQDAMAERGVKRIDMPFTPNAVWQALQAGDRAAS